MRILAISILVLSLAFLAVRIFHPDFNRDSYRLSRQEIRLAVSIFVGATLLAASANRHRNPDKKSLSVALCIFSTIGLLATFLPKPDSQDNWREPYSILLPFAIPAACAILALLWPDDVDNKNE